MFYHSLSPCSTCFWPFCASSYPCPKVWMFELFGMQREEDLYLFLSFEWLSKVKIMIAFASSRSYGWNLCLKERGQIENKEIRSSTGPIRAGYRAWGDHYSKSMSMRGEDHLGCLLRGCFTRHGQRKEALPTHHSAPYHMQGRWRLRL